jgi:TonB family protein
MSRSIISICVLAVIQLLTSSPLESLYQSKVRPDAPRAEVVLTKLADPLYPPVARQARITGDVELMLEIKKDGNVQSAIVVSGHPLLKQAALDSAEHSQFECRNCMQEVESYRLFYSFQLGPTSYCTQASDGPKRNREEGRYPRVIQSQDHVTLIDQPVSTCDMAFELGKVRSWKCFYLWRCASR